MGGWVIINLRGSLPQASVGQSKADAAASWHEIAAWKLDTAAGRCAEPHHALTRA